MQSEFHLGIIGGCLARQSGLGLCQLYPQQLAREVSTATGVALRVHLARYADGAYEERLRELAATTRLDGVILHMRALIIRKTALIVKHRSGHTVTYALHPFAFGSRRAGWTDFQESDFGHCLRLQRITATVNPSTDEANPHQSLPEDNYQHPLRPTRAFGLTFGQWNRLAGRLFGLEDWTVRDEMASVHRMRQASDDLGAHLAILTPLPAPEEPWIDGFGQRLKNELRDQLAAYPVPLCSVERPTTMETRALFMKDGIHMNTAGHAAVADSLKGTVVNWILARG